MKLELTRQEINIIVTGLDLYARELDYTDMDYNADALEEKQIIANLLRKLV